MKIILLTMMGLLRFNFLRLLVLFFCFSCLLSCTKELVENRVSGNALGTTYSIIYYDSISKDITKDIDSVFADINASMSTYIPNSDISKINSGDSTVTVDHMFQEVFNLSKQINHKTKGYFDPTVW